MIKCHELGNLYLSFLQNPAILFNFFFSFDSVLKDMQAENYDFKGLNFVVICMYRITKVCLKKKFYWYTVFTYNTHIYMYFMKSLYGLVYFRVRRRNKKHGGNSIEGQHKEDGH